MKYKELEDILLKPCSSTMRNKGKAIDFKGSVIGIIGKKIDYVYHIYGKVDINNHGKSVQTHIKINLKLNKLEGFKCSCAKHQDFKLQGHKFYCEHIAATAVRFLNQSSNKTVKINQKEKNNVNNDKTMLNIKTRIHYNTTSNNPYFELDFSIGKDSYYNVMNLFEFIKAIDNNVEYKINDNFIYSNTKYMISEEYNELVQFIRTKTNKNALGNKYGKIKIFPNELICFFNTLPKKEIIFKDRYLEYTTRINRQLIPLTITLKVENNNFIVTSEKNLPVPLNPEKTIYLFNREFYILERDIAVAFSSLYNKLKKNNCIYFPGNNINYHSLISLLSKVTSKVNITEGVKNYTQAFLKCKFILYKKGFNIYCIVRTLYGNKWIDIINNKSKSLWYRNYKWEEKLLMILENNYFIKNKNVLLFIGDENDFYNLITGNNSEVNRLGNIVLSKGLDHIKIINSSALICSIYDEEWAIKISYEFKGLNYDDFKGAYYAYKNGNNFYKTKDDSYIDISDEKICQIFSFISTLSLEDDLWKGMSYINYKKVPILKSLLLNNQLSFINNLATYESILKKNDIEGI